MPVIVALVIFLLLAWATWAVSVACYQSTYTDAADVTTDPNYSTVSECAIAAVTLTSFVPMPLGYAAGLIAWSIAVYGFLNLTTGRATTLVAYLAGWSVVSRLVVLGVLSLV